VTPAEILSRFDAEMRIDPPADPGIRYERSGTVVRAIGEWHAVVFAQLTPDDADAVIAREVAFFRSLAGRPRLRGPEAGAADENDGATLMLEWKVYGHDLPVDLGRRLATAGFEPDELETLVVFDLAAGMVDEGGAGATLSGLEIRRVTDLPGLADFIAVAGMAFGRDRAWQDERLSQFGSRLTDPAAGFYVAYTDGRAVASARAEFPPGRSFAGLWGGGTVPEYRGRGIYRALVRARAVEARRRGYRFLRVDARETSRPILERLGFIALTDIVEWRLSFSRA
jgi:ribosomal protein S18 acetylase RimI-like enzyme